MLRLALSHYLMHARLRFGIDAVRRWIALELFTVLMLPAVAAQTTTGSIRGFVTSSVDASPIGTGTVALMDNETGRNLLYSLINGSFTAAGLPPGVRHTIIVRSVGFSPAGMKDVIVTMGEERTLHFLLRPVGSSLDTVWVRSSMRQEGTNWARFVFSLAEVQRVPTLDRDVYDLVRLSPFGSTRTARAGLSIAGSSTRYNNFLLDGVSDRGLLGNFSAATGQGAKAISLDAVKEYQLIVSPFDVRYGDFSGGLVNAVTRSGQDHVEGSVFGFSRTDDIARKNDFLRRAPYQRHQYGFSLGGPLAPRRIHFFTAVERQIFSTPARGPFVEGTSELPVRTSDVARFQDILSGYGLASGTAGRVTLENPATNAFVRLDVFFPRKNSRGILWHNYADASNAQFTRESSTSFFTRGSTTFPLSSLRFESSARKSTTAAQLISQLSPSLSNEATVAIKRQPNFTESEVKAPLVSVAVPRAIGAGSAYLESGTAEPAHGVGARQNSLELGNALTLTHSRGSASIGVRLERFEVMGTSQPGAYGSWLFSSLDSLERGLAQQYRLVRRLEAARAATGSQLAIFAGERLSLRPSLTLVAGVRADVLHIEGSAPYNKVVDSLFGRSTAEGPGTSIEWSPRIGFEWQSQNTRLAGGAGIFSTRPPLGWLGQPQLNSGTGSSAVFCAGQTENDPAAPVNFVADYLAQPTACKGGRDTRLMSGGAVNLAKSRKSTMRALRLAFGASRRLERGLMVSVDALVTVGLADFAFANLNLSDRAIPDSMLQRDRRGRVVYGAWDAALRGRPRVVTSDFSEVIELQRRPGSVARQISTGLSWSPLPASRVSVSYTRSVVQDAQTPTSQFSFSENWQLGRVVAHSHRDLNRTTSALEVPHRIVLSARHTLGSPRYPLEVGFYYIGESGLPFTYIASAGQGRGDLNADGTNLNDPVYVPRSTLDAEEILFAGTQAEIAKQQADFEQMIEDTPCLRSQRGAIMRRNSCRAPWVNTTAATVRQTLPFGARSLVMQIDAFNLLNLVNSRWGKVRVVTSGPIFPLLEHAGQTPGPPASSESVFRYDPGIARFSEANAESAFQLQLGLRYSF